MNVLTTGSAMHIPDGDLVRILDDEVSTSERAGLQDHIEGCGECLERMQLLERRSHELASLLTGAMVEAPPAPTMPDQLEQIRAADGRRRPSLPKYALMRAAAVILVLVGAGVIASPARARIANWAEQGWNTLASVWQAEASGREQPFSGQAGTGVQFTPVGNSFSLDFANRQIGGSLLIRKAAVSVASAEVTGASVRPELLVLPAGVEVRNDPQSTAEYLVVVPKFVDEVMLRIDGSDAVTIAGSQLLSGVRVNLTVPVPNS